MKKRDDLNIEVDDELSDEIEFTGAVRGKYYEWAERAKGRFSLVSDEEDGRRQNPVSQEPRGPET
jgi:hypothetical protein